MDFQTPFKIEWRALQNIRIANFINNFQLAEVTIGDISMQSCLSKIEINDNSKVDYGFKYTEGMLTEEIVVPTTNKLSSEKMVISVKSEVAVLEFEKFAQRTFYDLGIVTWGEIPKQMQSNKLTVRQEIELRLSEQGLIVDNVLISTRNRESLILITNEKTGEYYVGVDWGISKSEKDIKHIRFKYEEKKKLVEMVSTLIRKDNKVLKGA